MIIRLICTNNNTRLICSPSRKKGIRTGNKTPILFQYTTGMFGFKGTTRSSIYAAETMLKKFINRLHASKLSSQSFVILTSGLGPTRTYILRKLAQLKITQIKDITPYPHNGCRKKKSLRK
jgi:small subunit ribosomal protein S11